ncbi:FAD-binding oxidoreductase [Tabrizicola sp. J26]|uniref:NAD(P)/FAD-dependent oxidoreductase n=1 Tax=Alitabrizicola rongguiensis TaxID=2909234 RepID=UPI001F22369E|nr:FAD-binding oxidoreductase [Tabrizicola rongguiensis]MCF1707201.1 FAD-binding oxidoreductase [Tabrizicola rongguiensis]
MPFPISEATPIRFPGPPPRVCDVVIIGGGVVGVMSAWFLAERGLKVALCEKGRIAGEQSSRNWGWIRQQGRDPGELPIMMEARRIWENLAQEFGDALGFQRTGVLYLANKEKDIAGFEEWMVHARAHGLDTRQLSAAEVRALLPGTAIDWPGGLFTASDARAEPWVAVPTLVNGAVARGVTVVENCAVRALDRAGGKVVGVITEQGRIACDQVVLAGGAWSSLFARAEGVTFPQLAVLASVAATEPMPEVYPGAAVDGDFAFRRRMDGGYTLAPGAEHDFFIGPDAFRAFRFYLPVLKNDWRSTTFRPSAPKGFPDAWSTARRWSADAPSPFEAMRVLNPKPNMATIGRVQDAFAKAYPALGRPKLKAVWAGMIDTMPDVVPVIDRVAAIPGLTIATGMSGHGFGIGPGIGRVVADLVAGNTVGHDLSRFRLSRFSDGSKIVPGPAL